MTLGRPRSLSIGDLEQRVLYSATPIPVPAESEPQACEVCEAAPSAVETAVATELRSIVFVDPSTPDYQQLVAGLEDDSELFEVFVLNAERDGVEQITEVLESEEPGAIGALHIVSHGSDGVVQLGSATVSGDSLAAYSGMLGEWERVLHRDADILFYGCDLAASQEGEALVRDLSILTGADVAASDDTTGHTSLGGDWVLEFGVGRIESDVAFDAATQAAWRSILPSPVLSVNSGATVAADSATTITATDLELSFSAGGAATVDVTITAANGTLHLTDTQGLVLTGGDWDGGTTFTMSGSEVDVQNAFNSGMVFVPTGGWSGVTTIDISVDAEGTIAADAAYVEVHALLGDPASGTGRVDLASTPQDESNRNMHAGVSRSIDTNAHGESVAVWTNDGTGKIHFATMAIDGTVTNTGELPGGGADSEGAAVAIHLDGSFVVVWEEGFSGFETVKVAKFNADGTANNAETPVPGVAALGVTYHAPTIGMNANGDYVIAYQSSAVGVEIQRFNSDGTLIDPSSVTVPGASSGEHVAVGMDGDGNVMVAWNDSSAVHLSRYDGSFTSLGTVDSGQSPVDPSLAMNDSGEAVLVHRLGSGEIQIQRVAPDGTFRGPELQGPVATDAAVAIDQSGNFVVAYQNAVDEVSVQRYTDAGAVLGIAERADFGTAAGLPAVSMLDPSNVIVVFTEQGVSTDVVANYFSATNATGPTVALADTSITTQEDTPINLGAIVTDQDTVSTDLTLSFTGFDAGLIDSVTSSGTGAERTITVTPVAGETGSTTIEVQVSDGSTTTSVFLRVDVNDAPVNLGPSQARTTPGAAFVFARAEGNPIRVVDSDATTVRVTLEVENGVLSLGDPGQVALIVGTGSDDTLVTFEGTTSQVNAAIDGLTYTPNVGFAGRETLMMTTDDQAGAFDTDALSIFVGGEVQTTDEFVVNTTSAGSQSTQGSLSGDAVRAVSILPDGGYVITWTGPDTDGTGVFAKVFNADGSVRAEEFLVATTTVGSQRGASVDSDGTGRFVVTWTGADADSEGVYYRRFNADATSIDLTEVLINTHTAGGQMDVHLAVNSAGDGVVAWHGDSALDAGHGVVARRFSMDGGLIGSEVQLNETLLGSQLDARVAINQSGDFVVTWVQSGSDLMYRRYNADGTPKAGEELALTASNMVGPAIAMADDGSFLLGYHRDLPTETAHFVAVAETGVVGDSYTIASVERQQVDIATDGSGVYRLVNRSSLLGFSRIHMDTVTSDGATISTVASDIPISAVFPLDESMPAIDMTSPENFVVAWTSNTGDGDGTAVFARAFGTQSPETLLFSTTGDASTPDTSLMTDGTVNSLTSLTLEDGTSTTTTGVSDVHINIDSLTGSNAGVSSFHRVSRDMLIGTGQQVSQVEKGDILFTLDGADTIGGLNVDVSDVVWARPVSGTGSYYVSILFNDLTNTEFSSQRITALTLVEKDTTVGDTLVGAGNLLFTPDDAGTTDDSLYIWHTEDVGGTTTGYSERLINGHDIGFTQEIVGVELIEEQTSVGGVTLESGTLLIATGNAVIVDGVTAEAEDVVAFTAIDTTLGAGLTTGDGFLLMDGSEIGLGDNSNETIDALSIVGVTPNAAPEMTASSPTLTPTDEDTVSAPFLVSSLLSGASDPNGDTVGIAFTATVGNGTWQYRTSGGGWVDVGSVSAADSLLLKPDAELRYQPDSVNGETASVAYRAWDQTTGVEGTTASTLPNGDTTAFSATQNTATLSVAEVNDRPVVDGGLSFDISEEAILNTSVGTVTATDDAPLSSLVNWTIQSGNTDGIFQINAGTGEITIADTASLDFESLPNAYTLQITVEDGSLVSSQQSVVINITDANDVPPTISAGQSFSVAEDATDGTAFGTVSASDVDTLGSLQNWQIVSGNTGAVFSIDALGRLTVANETVLDRESTASYTLTVTVGDGVNTSDTQTLSVSVSDVNEHFPVVTVGQSFTIQENLANGSIVGTVAATDAIATTNLQNWTLTSNPGNRFAIDPNTGQITVANASGLDYEAQTSHALQVRVSDDDFNSVARSVTINLDDVNDVAPIVTSGQNFSFSEAESVGYSVGVLAATDIDGPALSDWEIVSGNDGGEFAINAVTGELTVAQSLDFDTTPGYTLSVRVGDGVHTSATETVTISLTDVNDLAPAITTSQTLTVSEDATDGTSLGFISAVDPDAGTLQAWTIVSGNTGGAFFIDPATGEVTVADETQLDFETMPTYSLQLTVSDGVHVSSQVAVTINVSNVSDTAPVIDVGQVFVVAENSAAGTSVGTVTGSDADGDTLMSWQIVSGNDLGIFSIDPASGELTVNDQTLLDHEFLSAHTLTIRTTDGGTDSADETVQINVSNVGGEGRIRGNIYEDVAGDGVGGADTKVRGVTVDLYRDTGGGLGGAELIRTVTTTSSGYSFGGLDDATYYVVVDSMSIASTEDATLVGDVWAEQTWGSAGSLRGNTFLTTEGSMFGGRFGNRSDDASSLTTAEHVTRVVVDGRENGIDFGFSFNVVTNTLGGDASDHDPGSDRTVQGSLRQFIQNANAIDDVGNRMRFTPVTAANSSEDDNDWWTITVTEALPSLTDDGTIIDGTVWDTISKASVDFNTNSLGKQAAVGVGADGIDGSSDDAAISQVEAPDLEIVNDRDVAEVAIGLDVAASDIEIRNIAITGFGDAAIDSSGNIRIGQSTSDSFTGVVIEDNVIGATPEEFERPDSDFRTVGANIMVLGANDGVIRNNLIGFSDRWAIGLHTADGWTIEGNHIRGTATGSTADAAISMAGASSNVSILGNLIARTGGFGIETAEDSIGVRIVGNTINRAGLGGVEDASVRLRGGGHTVDSNTLKNVQTGVVVVGSHGTTDASTTNTISRNQFTNVSGLSVDLVEAGQSATENYSGDGLNSTVGYTTTSANEGIDAPYTIRAELTDGTVEVSGTAVPNATVEIYTASVDGRGDEYVTTVAANGSGHFSYQSSDVSVTGYSATATDASGNTSEFSLVALVNAVPEVTSADRFEVVENEARVVRLSAIDADGPVGDLTWHIVGGADAGRFVLTAGGDLSFATAPDFENPTDGDSNNRYVVVVGVQDGLGAATTHRVVVQVTPVNDNAPVFQTPQNISVAENQTEVVTLEATDADLPAADTVKYAIVGGEDGSLFQIEADTGILTFTEAANFEVPIDADGNNIYRVVVEATDGTNSTIAQYRVRVTNANEAPAGVQIDNTLVTENAVGATIGNLSTVDPDSGGSHTFTVSDTRFEVVDGRLKLRTGVSLDFEAASTVAVDVNVTDQNGLTDQETLEIRVRDQLLGTSLTENVDEDAANLTIPVVALFSEVPGGEVEYNISSSNSTLATAWIQDGQLQISFGEDAFGNGDITVQATVAGETAETIVKLSVSPINDAPVRHAENVDVDSMIVLGVAEGDGLLKHVSDVDDTKLTVELVPGQDAAFGDLTLNSDGSFDYVPGDEFEGVDHFQYRVSDGQLQSEPITVTLTVQEVAPVVPPTTSDPGSTPPDEPPPTEISSSGAEGSTAENTAVDSAPETIVDQSVGGTTPDANSDDRDLNEATPFSPLLLSQEDMDDKVEAAGLLSFLLGSDTTASSISRELTTFADSDDIQTSDPAQIKARAVAVIEQRQAFTREVSKKVDTAISSMEKDFENQASHEAAIIKFGTTGITGLSVGYIFWLLRGGSLVASMLTTIPAWRMVDPLPIVDLLNTDEEDQDSLDSLIQRGQEMVAGDSPVAS